MLIPFGNEHPMTLTFYFIAYVIFEVSLGCPLS
jgi:hypothetical protein